MQPPAPHPSSRRLYQCPPPRAADPELRQKPPTPTRGVKQRAEPGRGREEETKGDKWQRMGFTRAQLKHNRHRRDAGEEEPQAPFGG